MKEANGIYLGVTERFQHGELKGLSRSIKAVQHDAGVVIRNRGGMEIQTDKTICVNSKINGKQPSVADRIYDSEGIAVAITSGWLQNIKEPKIMAMRGRPAQVLTPKRTEYGKQIRKQYESGEIAEQRKNIQQLEPRQDGVTNTLTTVQKDNLLLENCRVRKLTPRECWRLMGFSDEDFDKAQAVPTSNSQLYKQAGNSIVKNVLMAIFGQMFDLTARKAEEE